jgi:hypothetical protein
MIHFGTFFGPVASARTFAVLLETTEGDKDYASLLPHHLPKVGQC